MKERFRVLVVDGSKDLRVLLTHLLQELGIEVITAKDAVLALDFLECEPMIDLVLSDFQMPGTNGIELFQSMKVMGLERPFVLMSGSFDFSHQHAIEIGMIAFLQKPFTPESLQQCLSLAFANEMHRESSNEI